MIEELMLSYTDNPRLLIISVIAFSIGYIEYIYSFRLVLRENSAPFPLWMHTFYFAHDLTAAIVFFNLAEQHSFFWFFSGASVALLIWNGFEIFNLYMAVKVERIAIWGRSYGVDVTAKQALSAILMQIVIMLMIVNLGRLFMHDETMFKWFCLTNIIMAVAPGYLWAERRSRQGASVGLAIVIFIGTVNTFLPPGYGMWTTALSYFDQPWFYACGVVASLVALRNVLLLLSFPCKPEYDAQAKRSIW